MAPPQNNNIDELYQEYLKQKSAPKVDIDELYQEYLNSKSKTPEASAAEPVVQPSADPSIWQTIGSGLLKGGQGFAGLGDLLVAGGNRLTKDFKSLVSPITPENFIQDRELPTDSAEKYKQLAEYFTDTPGVLERGQDTIPYKMAEYAPNILLGPGGAVGKLAADAALGTVGKYGNDIGGQGGELTATTLASLGPAAISKIAPKLAPALEGLGVDKLAEYIGHKPIGLGNKIRATGLDKAGKITSNAEEAVKTVGKKDLKFKDLEEAGFFDRLKNSSSPKEADLELWKFEQKHGKEIGRVIEEAAKKEDKILESSIAEMENNPTFRSDESLPPRPDFTPTDDEIRLMAADYGADDIKPVTFEELASQENPFATPPRLMEPLEQGQLKKKYGFEFRPYDKSLTDEQIQYLDALQPLVPEKAATILDSMERQPAFNNAKSFLEQIDLTPSMKKTLESEFNEVKDAWQNSDKKVKTLKKFQENWGILHQKAFTPKDTKIEMLKDDLHKNIYADLAEALVDRVKAVDPKLATKLEDANKAYSAAVTFGPSAFQASRKPLNATNLDPRKTGNLAELILIANQYHNPVVMGAIGAERAARLASELYPIATARGLKSAGKGIESLGKTASKLKMPGNYLSSNYQSLYNALNNE